MIAGVVVALALGLAPLGVAVATQYDTNEISSLDVKISSSYVAQSRAYGNTSRFPAPQCTASLGTPEADLPATIFADWAQMLDGRLYEFQIDGIEKGKRAGTHRIAGGPGEDGVEVSMRSADGALQYRAVGGVGSAQLAPDSIRVDAMMRQRTAAPEVRLNVAITCHTSGEPRPYTVFEYPVGAVQPTPTFELPRTDGGTEEVLEPAPAVEAAPAAAGLTEAARQRRLGFIDGRRVRTSLAAAIRTPEEIGWSPASVATSAAVAVALLLVVFPAELFNSTLEEHYDEVVGWLPWRRGRAPVERTRHAWMGFVGVALATAVLYQLLDPNVRLDRVTLTGALGAAGAVVVATFVNGAPARRWLHRKYRTRSLLKAYPAALVVAAMCVLISRGLSFQPGYLYGIVGGFALVKATPSKADAGRSAAVGLVSGLAVAVAAWAAHEPVGDRAAGGGVGWLALDALLAALYVGVLGGMLFGLVPLKTLTGHTLFQWRKPVWAAFFTVAAFAFVHTLLAPSEGEGSAVVVTVVLFVAFALASTSFWAYFRFRPPRPSPTAAAPAPQTPVEVVAAPSDFPPRGWEHLAVAEVVRLLPGLPTSHLAALRAAEAAGKRRKTLLRAIDSELYHHD